jgi:hypothetical protein
MDSKSKIGAEIILFIYMLRRGPLLGADLLGAQAPG